MNVNTARILTFAARYPRIARLVTALWRFQSRYMPRWLVPVFVVCAFVPGPIDEGIAVIACALIIACSRRRRRILVRFLRTAWSIK